MINREIVYKRDINNSYMIIPAMPEESYDEKLLLKRNIGNLLPMEKCYVASAGQYWYDITGKQALDAYCRINSIGKEFFENLILKLCQMVELLEWNLIDINCLVLDPELVFLNVYEEDVFFVAYPFHKGDLATELQQLMEFLLTKLNHKDTIAVGWAYKLYEMTLTEGMSIAALKRVILEERTQSIEVPEEVKCCEKMIVAENNIREENWEEKILEKIRQWKSYLWDMVKNYLPYDKDKKEREELPTVVYPEEEDEEESVTIHPTICIASAKKTSRVLQCDRQGIFPNFTLEQGAYIIGKSAKVQFQIDKDTISQFHARIEYQGDAYFIEDLNSTNGTYVNEQPLSYKSRKQLQGGDSIRFGDVEYHFY